MAMKKSVLSNGEILGLNQALNILNGVFSQGKLKMPTKASYALSRNIKFVGAAVKAFSDDRDEIIKEYIEMEDGRPKMETISNQAEIDAVTLSNTAGDGEAGIVPELVETQKLVFKDTENGEKEANEKIILLNDEKVECSLYSFPDLSDWNDDSVPQNALSQLWDIVDIIEEAKAS
jgi:hypothetical protein